MNTQLIDSLVQIIYSLSTEERSVLEEKLFFEPAYPSTTDIITLALRGSSFNFLAQEPDLYSLSDGEPIECP